MTQISYQALHRRSPSLKFSFDIRRKSISETILCQIFSFQSSSYYPRLVSIRIICLPPRSAYSRQKSETTRVEIFKYPTVYSNSKFKNSN